MIGEGAAQAAAQRERRGAFRRHLWVLPAAFAAHVVEEAPGFVAWAAELGSSMTLAQFLRNHVAYSAALVALVAWVHLRPTRLAVFCLMTWSAAQQLWNALFHLHLCFVLRVYGPGVVTAAALYLPIYVMMAGLALRERLLTARTLVVSLLLGGVGFAAAVKLVLFADGPLPAAIVAFLR